MKHFPVGAKVLVDGRDEVIVKAWWPEGTGSFLFPYYKVDYVGGDRNVAVSPKRVSVRRSK